MPPKATTADISAAVDSLLAGLEHPLADRIAQLRALIVGSAPGIAEGVKWNSPSFRTTGYFATINLRYRGGIAVILHLGAKARGQDVVVPDPAGILTWLGAERAAIPVGASTDLEALAPALQDIVRAWVRWV